MAAAGRRARRRWPRALVLAACGGDDTVGGGNEQQTELIKPSDEPERGADDLQLAGLHRPGPERDRRRVRAGDRHQGRVHRGRQRQRRSSSASCSRSWSRASRAAGRSSSSPTGWRSRCTTSATCRSSTTRTCRTSTRTCSTASRTPRSTPGAQLLDPVAERHDRGLGRQEQGPRHHVGQRPLRPEVQGQGHDADRDARHRAAGDEGRRRRLATATKEDWLAAIDKIQEAVDSGQIRRFTGNDYTEDLNSGNIVAAIGWSGDAIDQSPTPTPSGACPTRAASSGRTTWCSRSARRTRKPRWPGPNYVYDPKVAAPLAAYITYVTPVDGVQEVLAAVGSRNRQQPADLPRRAVHGELRDPDRPARQRRGRAGGHRGVPGRRHRLTSGEAGGEAMSHQGDIR